MNINPSHLGPDATLQLLELARWTLGTEPRWTDPLVTKQTKLLLLDSLACAVAALDVPTPRRVAQLIGDIGGSQNCSVIGNTVKAPVTSAVLMNGALVRSLDFNDVQWFMKEGNLSVAGHCSDNIPVAMAAAEHFGTSGHAMIEAIVMGYELFGRLRRLMPFRSAWDGTSASGLVAAAMYGRLGGFSVEKQATALAIGAMRCATPSVARWGKLSAAKDIANALIAQNGVQAAMLADLGVTGPLEILNHPGGLHEVFDPKLGLETLWGPLDEAPYIMSSHVKTYACIGTAQTTVHAALQLHPKLKDRLDDIVSVKVTMADLPMVRKQQAEEPRRLPKAREAACHSFTFLPAIAFTEGSLTDEQFRDRRWEKPDMVSLIERTTMAVDANLAARAPDSMPTHLAVVLRDGTALESECLFHPGHSFPDRGLNADVVHRKFVDITGHRLDAQQSEGIRSEVMELGAGTLDRLLRLLREIR